MCEWFARCTRKAVTTLRHPILGDVPICRECLDKYNALG